MTKDEFEKFCLSELEYIEEYKQKDNFDFQPADQYFSWVYMGFHEPFKELIQSGKLKDDLFDDIEKLKTELKRVQIDIHQWIMKACVYLRFIYLNDSNLPYQKKAALFSSVSIKILNGYNSELILKKFIFDCGVSYKPDQLDKLESVLDRRDKILKNTLQLIEKRITNRQILTINNELESSLKKLSSNIELITKPISESVKQTRETLNKISVQLKELIKQHRAEFDRRYDKYWSSMEAYLKYHGYIVPSDRNEFYQIFIYEILKDEDDSFERSLERKDFISFHKIIESKLLKVNQENFNTITQDSFLEIGTSNPISHNLKELAKRFYNRSKKKSFTENEYYNALTIIEKYPKDSYQSLIRKIQSKFSCYIDHELPESGMGKNNKFLQRLIKNYDTETGNSRKGNSNTQ
ncbi:MAG: hypothetical protein JJ895_12155 [Balneolaceae bacterium]|nr:hypothetical protein [Balneolaceae bacterium]